MTEYAGAKYDWLQQLREEANDRSVDVATDKFSFRLDYDAVGKIRATWKQRAPINLCVSDEVEFMNDGGADEYSRLFLVLLDIHHPQQFDLRRDDFYPVPESILKNHCWVNRRPSDGRYLFKADLSELPFSRWKNDWSKLFDPEDDESVEDRDIEPEWSKENSKVAELREIAERTLEEERKP